MPDSGSQVPTTPTHIRVRAVGVIRRGQEVLIQQQAGDDIWALPGGRVEPGEGIAEALQREMLEEVGRRVEVGELLAIIENRFTHMGVATHSLEFYFDATLSDDATSPEVVSLEERLTFSWMTLGRDAGFDLRPIGIANVITKPHPSAIFSTAQDLAARHRGNGHR